ncbi:hypothetical protein ACLB2K_075919 [Fragaria x ananassa]
MSTPAEYYRSLPPVSKTILAACLMTTSAYYLQLFDYMNISLDYGLIFKHYQVWRLFTNFLFLGPFSLPYAMEILIIAKYGVSLEKGPFDKRTADYVWMFIFGAMSLLGFYLPYVMMVFDLLLGNSLRPPIRGIIVGHLYYFLTVLYPLAGGNFTLKTPLWVHKVVAYWGEGTQINAPVQSSPYAGVVFQGRSYRLNGNTRRATTPEQQPQTNTVPQPNQGEGVAFRGRSHRLDRS